MVEEVDSGYDAEKSRLLQQDPKYVRFLTWLKESGAIFDKVEYPAVFDGGLEGARLLEDLEKNEVVLYVPNKCIISTEHAR